jgi:Na+-translocating ferredoxin:NAD+ oxidoreductase RnfG subunit
MKEATGELNMTVITLVAIAAIGALFYVFVWPMIQRTIAQQTCQTYGTNYNAEKLEKGAVCNTTRCVPMATSSDSNSNEKVSNWCCCKPATATQ